MLTKIFNYTSNIIRFVGVCIVGKEGQLLPFLNFFGKNKLKTKNSKEENTKSILKKFLNF